VIWWLLFLWTLTPAFWWSTQQWWETCEKCCGKRIVLEQDRNQSCCIEVQNRTNSPDVIDRIYKIRLLHIQRYCFHGLIDLNVLTTVRSSWPHFRLTWFHLCEGQLNRANYVYNQQDLTGDLQVAFTWLFLTNGKAPLRQRTNRPGWESSEAPPLKWHRHKVGQCM
jgi:hypothetical protein